MKKRKGFFMIEIIIVVTSMAFIFFIASQLINSSLFLEKELKKEANWQSDFRIAADRISKTIQEASGVYILPISSFNHENIETNNYLTKDWNYIGLEKKIIDGQVITELCEYIYDEKAPGQVKHIKKVLLTGQKGLFHELNFKSDVKNMDSKIVKLYLKSKSKDDPHFEMEIDTKIQALNSLQVVNWSSEMDPGVAIAYQTQQRDYAYEGANARVILLMDISSSMNSVFSYQRETRMDVARSAARKIIHKFATNKRIEMCIIPFNENADCVANHNNFKIYKNGKYEFFPVQNEKLNLEDYIYDLTPSGATNAGDGLRRAYHAFNNQEHRQKEYLIVLTDGDSNYCTLTYGLCDQNEYDNKSMSFLKEDGNIDQGKPDAIKGRRYIAYQSRFDYTWRQKLVAPPNQAKKYVYGGINAMRDYTNFEYIRQIGEMLKQRKTLETYVIGISRSISTDSLKHLRDSLNAKMYHAYQTKQLLEAFDEISDQVLENLWFIEGPKATPIEMRKK